LKKIQTHALGLFNAPNFDKFKGGSRSGKEGMFGAMLSQSFAAQKVEDDLAAKQAVLEAERAATLAEKKRGFQLEMIGIGMVATACEKAMEQLGKEGFDQPLHGLVEEEEDKQGAATREPAQLEGNGEDKPSKRKSSMGAIVGARAAGSQWDQSTMNNKFEDFEGDEFEPSVETEVELDGRRQSFVNVGNEQRRTSVKCAFFDRNVHLRMHWFPRLLA
jgi:hypothetical protein